MLLLSLPAVRFFNEETEEYVSLKPVQLRLEHSLISVSKWESKWHKSYLSATSFTKEEFVDYVRCMAMDSGLEVPLLARRLTVKDVEKIRAYIRDPMTATTFSKRNDTRRKQSIITSEIVYYWMISYGIPIECEKWHLNRLLTLVEVCSLKQNSQKMSKMDAARMRASANEARRKKLGTKG